MARSSETVIACAVTGDIHTPPMSDALAAAETESASDPPGLIDMAVLARDSAQDSLSEPGIRLGSGR